MHRESSWEILANKTIKEDRIKRECSEMGCEDLRMEVA